MEFDQKQKSENEQNQANFYFSKMVIHFQELNLKIIELYKQETISRFYEIKRLSEDYKVKLANILQEIPRSFEKEIQTKLNVIYEKYKIWEKTKMKTEAKIYSKHTEDLKLNKNNIGAKVDPMKDENSLIKNSIRDYLININEKTKAEIEILRKERDSLKQENKISIK